ncbi:MAG: phosphatidylserine decarboxylase [Hyphomicrobiaceae bacterium]
MSKGHGLIETILGSLVPVHRDGHKFVAIAAVAAAVFFLLWAPLGWVLTVVALYIAYFFRDPPRVTPLRDGLVIAPADGEVSAVELVTPPMELGLGQGQRVRISTFLSVFDVHINRAPVPGKVLRSIYVPGAFINAASDKASEDNERRSLVIQMANGEEVAVVQIAGLIARRIVTFSQEGDFVGVGQRFGLIRFGSRVDVYLPPGSTALVSVGQRAVAGETVFADFFSSEPEREARKD